MILQQLANALTLTAIYALIAVGVTLFFGVVGIVNLAHGDVAMIGAFAGLGAYQLIGSISGITPPVVAILAFSAAILTSAVLGWAMYQLAFRPLQHAPPIIGLLASIGVGFVIRESVLNFYPDGRNPQPYPSMMPVTTWELGDVFLLSTQVFIVVSSIVLVIALAALIERTRLGRAMRSIVNSKEVSRLLGVRVNLTIAVTFVVGAALAGFAGVINGLYYSIVQSDMGISLTVKGFTAAVIGGLGNMYGALLGALVVGLIEAFVAGFIPQGGAYKEIAVFLTLILILLVRPSGLIREKFAEKV